MASSFAKKLFSQKCELPQFCIHPTKYVFMVSCKQKTPYYNNCVKLRSIINLAVQVKIFNIAFFYIISSQLVYRLECLKT